jgi:hypothetical protein
MENRGFAEGVEGKIAYVHLQEPENLRLRAAA